MRLGARGIHLYELWPEDGSSLPLPAPGSHIDLILPNGLIRQYSLVTPKCTEHCYVIGVKHEPAGRGGSRWLHQELRLGQSLLVGACRNAFELAESDSPYVLFAGGIGITPIYSMYCYLKAQGRQVHLHYWGESAQTMLFHDELAVDADVTLYPKTGYPKTGQSARPRLKALAQSLSKDAQIYCCGPGAMIEDLVEVARECGLSDVHYEYFGKIESAAPEGAQQVTLAKSGRVIDVAEDESILEALVRNDVDVMYSCEQGICGACEVRFLEGDPVHMDRVKEASEHTKDRTMMICCSRAGAQKLVLDI
ncbi:PDR/VanB family oxidoreductase [Marinobacterium lutimaris]|uniref:Vanillate O-demethylase ferredoxin subunit n=1 Tax=Marinobacterium lutimaris TaxID=568106 RepID=A0A1H6D6T5_9GAMM|nr:PDR/VanB family oxidoreductase [Marinobacterium lutimaris]SEG80961.1 vanillate O-demethylase ferredoxin subunit [Marinobacterium lutimaris]